VVPDTWSPNRITFHHLSPDFPLIINLNRGYPWYNSDTQLFPHDRIVEFGLPFTAMPDQAGEVDLNYRFPCQMATWVALALAWLVALGLLALWGLNWLRNSFPGSSPKRAGQDS
jgi:hypothetical protein